MAPQLAKGPLQGYLGMQLRLAHIHVMAEVTEQLLRMPLTPGQYTVLVVIAANKGVKQVEIASAMRIQKANLAPTIALLEHRGFVQRALSEIDGRVHYLAVTARGKSMLARANRAMEAVEARILAALGSRAARDRMIKQLIAISGALQHPAVSSTDRKMLAAVWQEVNLPAATR